MEPEVEALDNQLKQTDTVKQLQTRDEEIVSDLEGLKEGQKQLNDKVELGFEKGRKRMDGIEGELKQVKEMLVDSGKKRDAQHTAILNKITESEISRLEKKLETRENQLEKKDSRVWEVFKIALTAIISIAVTVYLVGAGLK